MSKQIQLTDELFERLQGHAEPLVDTTASVIERLTDFYELHNGEEETTAQNQAQTNHVFLEDVEDRPARKRGAVIELDGYKIEAASVGDMYSKVLERLDKAGHLEQLREHLPISTSRVRHLLAREPFHPRGNEFQSPVEYDDLYMESGKDYKNALNHLCQMLNRCGVKLTYHGCSEK